MNVAMCAGRVSSTWKSSKGRNASCSSILHRREQAPLHGTRTQGCCRSWWPSPAARATQTCVQQAHPCRAHCRSATAAVRLRAGRGARRRLRAAVVVGCLGHGHKLHAQKHRAALRSLCARLDCAAHSVLRVPFLSSCTTSPWLMAAALMPLMVMIRSPRRTPALSAFPPEAKHELIVARPLSTHPSRRPQCPLAQSHAARIRTPLAPWKAGPL